MVHVGHIWYSSFSPSNGTLSFSLTNILFALVTICSLVHMSSCCWPSGRGFSSVPVLWLSQTDSCCLAHLEMQQSAPANHSIHSPCQAWIQCDPGTFPALAFAPIGCSLVLVHMQYIFYLFILYIMIRAIPEHVHMHALWSASFLILHSHPLLCSLVQCAMSDIEIIDSDADLSVLDR